MTDKPGINLTKFTGELVEYDEEKLKNSLFKSGASDSEVRQVLEVITPMIYEGMSTQHLYKLAFRQLKKFADSLAARYSLKQALMDLGPAGYYFEKWVANFFTNYGFDTMTSQLIPGMAVKHEADVIARKGGDTFWIECKFRNTPESKISVTTPMYLLSRIKDISVKTYDLFGEQRKFTKGWLVTNANLTSDSIQFGEYYGIEMLAWDYPKGRSVKNLVDHQALYPITCLTTLTQKEKEELLAMNCIMVKDLRKDTHYLDKLNLSERKRRTVFREICDLIDKKTITKTINLAPKFNNKRE